MSIRPTEIKLHQASRAVSYTHLDVYKRQVFVQQSKEAALDKPSGITYAIPIRYVRELLERAEAKGQ